PDGHDPRRRPPGVHRPRRVALRPLARRNLAQAQAAGRDAVNEFLRKLLFLPEQASSYAYLVDRLHYFVIITTLIMSTAVGMTAIAFFLKFRRRHEGQRTPHIETNTLAEVLFVTVP